MKFMVICNEKRENPYRLGTHKFDLFGWALEQEDGFSKAEFLKAENEIFASAEGRKSKMSDEVRAKAWWNEFANKHKTFVSAE